MANLIPELFCLLAVRQRVLGISVFPTRLNNTDNRLSVYRMYSVCSTYAASILPSSLIEDTTQSPNDRINLMHCCLVFLSTALMRIADVFKKLTSTIAPASSITTGNCLNYNFLPRLNVIIWSCSKKSRLTMSIVYETIVQYDDRVNIRCRFYYRDMTLRRLTTGGCLFSKPTQHYF